MSNLSSIEKRKLEKFFEMSGGYVLDFSNRRFKEFIIESVSIDIYDNKYEYESGSKANRLRYFWDQESNHIVGKVILDLLEYWKTQKLISSKDISQTDQVMFDECSKISDRLTQDSRNDDINNADQLFFYKNCLLPKKIFISYAWGGESEEFVNKLDQAFQAKGATIIRDKRDLGYKQNIRDFMEKIGRGKCVIAVISDKYLKSDNCMFELVEVAKDGKFYDRIFPIVLADAQIYKPVERIKYIKYWEDKIQELDEAIRSVSAANLQGFREEIDQYTDIRRTVSELTNIFKNMNTLTPDMHSEVDFEVLFLAIENKLSE